MKEQDFERSNTSVPPAEPHFDDELTIAFARPVVPLEKIEARARTRRHWILGGAFAVAMMLGAASALLASYLKLRNVPNSATAITEVEATAAPVAVSDTAAAGTMASELPLLENGGGIESTEHTEENTEELATPATHAKAKRKTPVRNTSEATRPRVVSEGDEETELDRIREAVLFDSWQERRARRAARRERRNRADHHDRDLSNLDEIFEGPRRRRQLPY